ncbi:UNVERIFIED_ORG: NAD(P)-dependent dehydrogenase (short-subunit alcohol dehydrogenase family) [Enterobacter sp. JUb101]|nr:NAD(P)-dependent dehydrogenase (short-subunit alcohol dehydrogenase family) [Lelliottia amnigena]
MRSQFRLFAAAVTFLASPQAGQISGTGLDVDGGLNA